MQKTKEKIVVGIRFQTIGKLFHFDATSVPDIKTGDYGVVDTSRGTQLGQVMGIITNPPKPPNGTWKRVDRIATPKDLMVNQEMEREALKALIYSRDKASKYNYVGLKLVKAEISFDNSYLAILYNIEDDKQINLSRLEKDIKTEYRDLKVELRRIGPRDVGKIVGGMGVCGIASRCCSTFLTEFSPISIKMAKAQGISLDTEEITGMCGRLRCCLIFEYEQYVEARKVLPKRGKKVMTPEGKGKVIDLLPLKEAVIVLLEGTEYRRIEFNKFEIEPWNELEALRRKANSPCDKHEGGGCDCGKDRKK
jgi:cell fate regulator YaaT (PSP1 superfamily)